MTSLFDSVGCNTKKLDQEDCKDTSDWFHQYCERIESKPAFTLLDIKDTYLYKESMSTKHFITIALKSPANDFTGYKPPLATLNPEYLDTSVNVKKSNFVRTFANTWAKGNGIHTRHNQYDLFWWYFTGHLFLVESITGRGYPAWLPLKHALDVPHIKDLLNADSIHQETFRMHFIREGLIFEEEHRETIHTLTQEIILWVQSTAETYNKVKPQKVWLSESLPSICLNLLKEYNIECTAEDDVEKAYKFLLSFAGKIGPSSPTQAIGPSKSSHPKHISIATTRVKGARKESVKPWKRANNCHRHQAKNRRRISICLGTIRTTNQLMRAVKLIN